MKDINLLLKEEKAGAGDESAQAKSGKAAGIAKTVTILIIVAAFVSLSLAAPRAYVATLEAKASQIEKEMASEKYMEVKNINSQLEKVSTDVSGKQEVLDFIDGQGYTADGILKTIRNNVPEGCAVNSMEFDYSTLRMAVKFRDIANVAEFLLNMERSSYITLSDASRNLKINENGEYTFTFDIVGKTGAEEGQ